jgi:hypothetical protein
MQRAGPLRHHSMGLAGVTGPSAGTHTQRRCACSASLLKASVRTHTLAVPRSFVPASNTRYVPERERRIAARSTPDPSPPGSASSGPGEGALAPSGDSSALPLGSQPEKQQQHQSLGAPQQQQQQQQQRPVGVEAGTSQQPPTASQQQPSPHPRTPGAAAAAAAKRGGKAGISKAGQILSRLQERPLPQISPSLAAFLGVGVFCSGLLYFW